MTDARQLAETFLETFDKGGVDTFRAWLNSRPNTEKWIIGADFALRDKSRPNDCFAFSIIPYEPESVDYRTLVERQLPKDIKHSRTLTSEGAALLRNPAAFHILVPINRDRVFFNAPDGQTEKDVARACLRLLLEQRTTLERGPEAIKLTRQAIQKSKANAFNVGLFTDLTILSVLLPIITLLITRERQPSVMGWFCDRDSMSGWCDGFMWGVALENLRGLAQHWGIASGPNPVIGLPDRSGPEEYMWFDHLIRLPDWLAGTLATWDRKVNFLPNGPDKYLRVVEDVLADAENILILGIEMRRDVLNVSRTTISSAPETNGPL